ncbi:hypothetical protein KGP26_29735 (plasmid) [Serratia sp. JSRIV002]|uniref:hypothetical protein n=1 Tax=Serratia sp. JSRIV002 TaxID=2831894 RepID=UPI001CBF990F|nr:hypothetical protein [Serratia sp. JSRIV002]UAN54732.1 hypothetical protein KGP26_29735 [Serratia sp. JSRIV002]
MAELTAEEKKWVKQMNALLKKCPSKRIGFYTIGDNDIGLYDIDHQDAIDAADRDLVRGLNYTGHGFAETIVFPGPVNGVCG